VGRRAQESGELKLKIMDMLFGCWHKRLSFPMSSRRGQRRASAACQTGAYVVCLDCGQEFAYDWQRMRIVSAGNARDVAPASLEAKAS
jgi:hypothetical protein